MEFTTSQEIQFNAKQLMNFTTPRHSFCEPSDPTIFFSPKKTQKKIEMEPIQPHELNFNIQQKGDQDLIFNQQTAYLDKENLIDFESKITQKKRNSMSDDQDVKVSEFQF